MADAVADLIGALMCPAICFGIVAFFAVIAVIGFFFRNRAVNDCNDKMKAFCAMTGLTFNENKSFRGTVTGNYNGHEAEMGYFSREYSHGRDRQGFQRTRTKLFFYAHILAPKIGAYRLGLSKEGIWSGLGKAVGITKEVEIGVPDFDSRYVINSEDAARTKRLLQPEARKAVDVLVTELRYGLSIGDNKVYVEREASGVGPAEMQKIADALAVLADAAEAG